MAELSDAERQFAEVAAHVAAHYGAVDQAPVVAAVIEICRATYAAAMRAAAARVRGRCRSRPYRARGQSDVCVLCEDHATDLEAIAERVKRGERAAPRADQEAGQAE